MSYEVFGSDDDGIDADVLYRRGWESNPDCTIWWKTGEPNTTYTIQEAWYNYREWIESED